jgi:rfaE bifunctional protein kinase chain/domain
MKELSVSRSQEILENAKNKKVAIIGDLMLDRFFWGNVNRISPEAPVPVIELLSETNHLGGAANVAANLQSLGLVPIMLGVLGNDNAGNTFLDLCKEQNLVTTGIFIDKNRPTTAKTRIIGNNQHIARVDREVLSLIENDVQNYFLDYLNAQTDLSAIILEDYNKGVLPAKLIREIINFANDRDIFIAVDPKQDNFFEYKNVDLFKPNKKEASKALDIAINSKTNLMEAGNKLLETLNVRNVMLTLGSEGMILFQNSGDIFSVPTRARQVADVSGAGDTAIATYTAAAIGNANSVESASMANFASGAVCEQPGVVPITPDALISTIQRNGTKEIV